MCGQQYDPSVRNDVWARVFPYCGHYDYNCSHPLLSESTKIPSYTYCEKYFELNISVVAVGSRRFSSPLFFRLAGDMSPTHFNTPGSKLTLLTPYIQGPDLGGGELKCQTITCRLRARCHCAAFSSACKYFVLAVAKVHGRAPLCKSNCS